MKHRDIRTLVILALTLFGFMLLTNHLGMGAALLIGLPFGLLMGIVARRVNRWIGD